MEIDNDTRTRIMHAVDSGFSEQLDFTGELIKFPSVRGEEHTAQDFMAAAMAGRGLTVDRWRLDVEAIQHLPGFSPGVINYDNSFNVVGAHRPQNAKGRSLILNGHIDVVPEGPHDMWSSHPYVPRRDGDWLYGRGGGDMKAGLASCLYALDALRNLGYRPAADVYVQSVIEEECTGNGALACLARGYRAEAAVIPEPMGDALSKAQTGTIWFQVEVRGHPVHASTATSGANAIEAALRLIGDLKVLEASWNEDKHSTADFSGHDHPINFNIGRIAGGDWPSSVPAWCRFDVRAAIFPEDDIAVRRQQLEDCIAEAAARDSFLANSPPRVSYNGFWAEGYSLRDADDAIAVLEDSHRQAYGADLQKIALTATTDARFFGLYANTPGLVYGAVAQDIHGFDERVSLESIRKNTQSIALFIAQWCGLEKI